MKKVLIYISGMVLLSFLIPIMFTEQFVETKSDEIIDTNNLEDDVNGDNQIIECNEVTVNEANTKLIKVLFTETNEVREINLEDYLYGVVSAEMPANFELEALKAQAVVARTYSLYRIENNTGKHGEAVLCTDSTCCQAWISKEDRLNKWPDEEKEKNWNKIIEAVNSTAGQVITYNGHVINAFFHANSGGKTEIPANVWGGEEYPYLQIIETSGEEGYSQYESEAVFTKEELLNELRNSYSDIEFELSDIEIVERYESGRVKTIRFGNKKLAGVEIRKILNLKSANFEIFIEDDKLKIVVYGYGHGVGMSQTGANSLAKQGKNYSEIIKYFYTGVEVVNVDVLF